MYITLGYNMNVTVEVINTMSKVRQVFLIIIDVSPKFISFIAAWAASGYSLNILLFESKFE
jgi:hypothetical protein